MSKQNFFLTLFALQVASRATGSQTQHINYGGYKTQAREYLASFSESALADSPDNVLFGPIDLLWRDGCLELNKYFPEKNEFWGYEEVGGLMKFISNGDFGMKLTPKGQALLADMKSALDDATPPKRGLIGFSVSGEHS